MKEEIRVVAAQVDANLQQQMKEYVTSKGIKVKDYIATLIEEDLKRQGAWKEKDSGKVMDLNVKEKEVEKKLDEKATEKIKEDKVIENKELSAKKETAEDKKKRQKNKNKKEEIKK